MDHYQALIQINPPKSGSRKPEAGSRKPEAGSRKPKKAIPSHS
jgi:hypothetical protein